MRVWRWIASATAAVFAAGLLFVAWVYAASEAHYRSYAAPAPFTHPIPEAAIAHGERLSFTRRRTAR